MKQRMLISISDDVKEALITRAAKAGRSMSDEISRLVLDTPEAVSTQDVMKMERDHIAATRAVERELRIMKGLFNSLFVGFRSLDETHFTDPEKTKHQILGEAEAASWLHIKEERARNTLF